MKLVRHGCYQTLAVIATATVLLLAPNSIAVGQEQKTPKSNESEPSVWMRKKLDFSRNILAGLASEDFDRVATNAQAMQGMSKLEWFIRGKVPGYRTQLEIFQDANEQIIRQAQKDNIEGAALAFTQLTISCVNCHKHLRDAK